MNPKKFAPVILGLLFLMATLNPTRLEACRDRYESMVWTCNTAGVFGVLGGVLLGAGAVVALFTATIPDQILATHCPSGMDYAGVGQCKVNPVYAELGLTPTKSLDGCNYPCTQGYSYDFASADWVDPSTLSYPNGYVTPPQPDTCGRDPGTWKAYHQLATCMTTQSGKLGELRALNFSRPADLPDGCSVAGESALVTRPCVSKRYSDSTIFWGRVGPFVPGGASLVAAGLFGCTGLGLCLVRGCEEEIEKKRQREVRPAISGV